MSELPWLPLYVTGHADSCACRSKGAILRHKLPKKKQATELVGSEGTGRNMWCSLVLPLVACLVWFIFLPSD